MVVMKKYILFILLFLFAGIGVAQQVGAMTIEANYGLKGISKNMKPVEMVLTVENGDKAFDGEIAIRIPEGHMIESTKVFPLKLSANEVHELRVMVGNYDGYSSNRIQIKAYEGSLEDGDELKGLVFRNKPPKTLSEDTIIILLMTDQLDNFEELEKLRTAVSRPIELVHFDVKNTDLTLANDPSYFEFANVLIIDGKKLNELDDQVQKALLEWVRRGGKVVVNQDLIDTSFAPFSPLTYLNSTLEIDKVALNEYVSRGEFEAPLTIIESKGNSKVTQIKIGETVIAGSNSIGAGKLIQTAFNYSEPALTQENGYVHLLQKVIQFNQGNLDVSSTVVKDVLSFNVKDANELFKSNQYTVWRIILPLIVYILILGPMLYYVLKRKDKREAAWWAIPVIAVVSSLLLFSFGAGDRFMKPKVQTSQLLYVTDEGNENYFVQSVLSNRAGDYTFQVNEGVEVFGYPEVMLINPTQNQSNFYMEEENRRFVLKDMKYWGIKSIAGIGKNQQQGQLDIQLVNESGQITGTIKNSFSFDLQDIEIWSGVKFYPVVGEIKAGETIEVNITLDSQSLLASINLNMFDLREEVDTETIDMAQLESLYTLTTKVNSKYSKPVVVAKTEEIIQTGAMVTGKTRETMMTLVAQPFDVTENELATLEMDQDSFALYQSDDESFAAKYPITNEDFQVYPGMKQYLLYELPANIHEGYEWNSLQVMMQKDSLIQLAIYNEKKEVYEPIEATLETDDVLDYVVDGQLRLELQSNITNPQEGLMLPSILLKGEPNND